MESERLGEEMTELALAFPSMRSTPGIDPWDPGELNRWAAGPASHGERHTARFLLGVWDPAHRAAFLEWADDPWWA